MSIASQITRINTNIANSYTAVDNKNGTLPQVQNSANLASAIDSIEVIESAIAEGESLSLTNTKAMPYNDFVVEGKSEQDGEPSPSIPSEIHSVADDVNLWFLNSSYATATGSEYVLKDTDFSLPAGTYTISFKKSDSVYVQINIKTTTQSLEYYFNNTKNTETITFTEDVVKVALYIGGNQANTISNIKLQKGTVATPYSPYNQGTVTIKQRGTTESNDYTIQTEPLRSLPNGVKYTIEADGIHRRVGKRLLQASDIYDIVTTRTIPYVRIEKSTLEMVRGTFANNTALMRSYAITGNISYPNTSSGQFNTYYDKYFLAIFDDRFTDLETAKQLLEGEEIIYELAEETIEPLTQNQATTMLDIIKTGSYEGTTNIYTDEDVKPTMKVGYYKKG